MDDQPVFGSDVARVGVPGGRSDSTRRCGSTWRAARPVRYDGVADSSGRHRHLAAQRVGVGESHEVGDVADLGREQPVHGTAGGDVQGIANVEQSLVRLLDSAVRPVGQPGGRERAEHDHVAQAAAGLLEVGLQQVRRVAGDRAAARPATPAARAAACGRCCATRPAAPSRAVPTSSASPASTRRSSSPTPALSSRPATSAHSAGVRTEWSSLTPASQSGYQSSSASG